MKFRWGLFSLCILSLFCSCHEKPTFPYKEFTTDTLSNFHEQAYIYNSIEVRRIIDSLRIASHDTTYIDLQVNRYYANHEPFLWVDRQGIDHRCDTLINELEKMPAAGFRETTFFLPAIRTNLNRLRQLNFTEKHDVNHVMAAVEYYLTKAYLRYSNGQRFGFINPRKLFNNLDPIDNDTTGTRFRTLFDIPIQYTNKKFLRVAFASITNGRLSEFLTQVRPTDSLYYRFLREFQQNRHLTRDQRHTLWVNMERLRWRVDEKRIGKYVVVNLPAFQLWAINDDEGETLTMRIGCGRLKNKTPLLVSRIQRIEFNPHWIVPQSIVRKEIAAHHTGDVSYFTRKRMKIIDKTSEEEVAPERVTRAMLESGNYRVQQEKGEGNALGRMIFRFPNNFSIFLHDTDSRDFFTRKWRGVSHGCVRLERPLDLAIFLLPKKDDELIDKFRIAIDEPPLTDFGRQIISRPNYRRIGLQTLKPAVPLFISYFTAYPNREQADIVYYPDIYGYDALMLRQMEDY